MEATDQGGPVVYNETPLSNTSTMVASELLKACGLTMSPQNVLDTFNPTEPSTAFEGSH